MRVLNFLSGITVLLAIFRWLQVRLAANKLGGIYLAENIDGRTRIPMPGAGLTIISPRPFWSLDPSIVDVRGQDIESRKVHGHGGQIKIDPGCLTGERIVDYDEWDERSRQQVEFSDDYKTLYVFPVEPGYGRHVLRRARGLLVLR